MRNPATISNAVQTAILETVRDNLRTYLPGYSSSQTHFHTRSEVVEANQCPAVGIWDQGWETIYQTISGVGESMVGRVFRYDLVVHVKARRIEDLTTTLNEWMDGIYACLQDHPFLGITVADLTVQANDPTVPFAVGSEVLQAGALNLEVEVWSQEGEVSL